MLILMACAGPKWPLEALPASQLMPGLTHRPGSSSGLWGSPDLQLVLVATLCLQETAAEAQPWLQNHREGCWVVCVAGQPWGLGWGTRVSPWFQPWGQAMAWAGGCAASAM
jgi:hypothetical protein